MIRWPFQLRGPRGGRLRGEVCFREGPLPRSAVLLVHGFKGYARWGFFPHVGAALALEGYAVVTFDFSHNGAKADGEGVTDLDAFALNTYTREVDELNHLLETVASGELTPRRPRKTGILGFSRGGAVAILAAAENPGVDALVTWAAIDHLDRWTEETVQEWREKGVVHVFDEGTGRHLPLSVDLYDDFLANRERLDVARAAGLLSAPWLIVHGIDDLTVSPREGKRLARISGRARLVLVEEAGHCFGAGDPFQDPTPPLREALQASLRHFAVHLGS